MTKKLILSLVVLLAVINCGERALPHSAGGRDDIILITPDNINTDSLINSLEKEKFYPTVEQIYEVKKYNPEDFDQYKYWRNLIVIGWLGRDYVDNLLSGTARKTIEDEGANLFVEEDMWVKLQSVVIIAGKNQEGTQNVVNRYGDVVYDVFRNKERERFKTVLYMDGVQEKKMKNMEEILGATYKIPPAYVKSQEGDNYMTYIRKEPDRLVTLLYRNDSIKNPVKFRNKLFLNEFEGDVILDSLTTLDTVKFNDVRALRLEGIWQNMDKVMGGPFVSYVFEKNGIWYFLDGHVFAPGKKKWPYLDEVDIILHSFRTEI